MSYLVLARKARPRNFSEVVGQKPVVRTLQNALSQDRVAHAIIFSGVRGVGKTTLARILAKCLNCDKGPTAEPCNDCSPCREIDEGRSLDVYEINDSLLEKLACDDTPETVKVFNLLKSIENMVNRLGKQAPYLYSIGERAIAIARAFQERQQATQEALQALEELIHEINLAEQERAEMNLMPESFAIYWLLQRDAAPNAEWIARNLRDYGARIVQIDDSRGGAGWRAEGRIAQHRKHRRRIRQQHHGRLANPAAV